MTPLGPGIKITMVRAEHSSELAWKNPATGSKEEQHVGGEPSGYIIEGNPGGVCAGDGNLGNQRFSQ